MVAVGGLALTIGYWALTLGDVPFPIIEDWSTVGAVIETELSK